MTLFIGILVIILLCSLILMIITIIVSRVYMTDAVRYTFSRAASKQLEASISIKVASSLPHARHYLNVVVNGEEIDMISVTDYGILVFEFKNIQGSIRGSSQNKNWTRAWKTGVTYSFKNPIIQNEKHILALKDYLKEYAGPYTNVIVFGPSALLSDVKIEDSRAMVLHSSWLNKYTFSRFHEYKYDNKDAINHALSML